MAKIASSLILMAAASGSLAFVSKLVINQPLASSITAASQLSAADGNSFFASIPFPKPPSFGGSGGSPPPDGSEDDGAEFEATSIGLIRQARRLLASDFGILDPSLLDDVDFVWIGPFVDEPLGKVEYLAAGRFFDLRSAFPDLDYRPHDFRIDETDPYTIRISCRVTGTMRGALRLRDGTLPPTGKRMKCPPEAVSITFNQYGKVIKLCTGFCIDRQVGNTKGSTGVMAAALVAGQAPSDWDLYPAPAVFRRFFGRPIEPILETKSVLAPFPETVMVQLAKGILATNMAANDPTLLADNFEFNTPYNGPIGKSKFIDTFAVQEFENVDPSFSHFRVDPYDPVRVWVDVLPKGVGYEGCPQAMSFAFDDEGFCERITSSFVMDPSIGNGGGLGGPEGYRYAMGKAAPGILTRPWARLVGRARKAALSPLTGVAVDDFVTSVQARTRAASPVNGLSEPEMLKPTPVESLSALKASVSQPVVAREPEAPAEDESGLQSEIAKRETETREEEARLKKAGAEEAKALISEVEEAEKKALEARAKLDKLEAERLESERRLKVARDQQAARVKKLMEEQAAAVEARRVKAQEEKAAAEQRKSEAEKNRATAAEQAKARQAQAAAKYSEQLKATRAAAEQRLKEQQAARAAQAEERKKRQEAQRAAAAQKRAEAAAKREAQIAARQERIAKQKAEAEKKRAAAQAAAEAKRAAQAKARQEQMEAQKADQRRQAELRAQQEKAQKEAAAAWQQELAKEKAAAAKQKAAELKAAAEAKRAADAKARAAKLAEQKKARLEAERKRKLATRDASSTATPEEEEAAREARAAAALETLSGAVTRATISLFGAFNAGSEGKDDGQPSSASSTPAPPRGVPVLKRWRKTPTGAVSGNISGSRVFDEGERVTTSPIVQGNIASGEVVRTGSGSRYYLQ